MDSIDPLKQPAAEKLSSKIVQRLDELSAQYNGITAQQVLDDARNEDSPLHSRFEWNDDVAAEQYRLHQARWLIASFKIVINQKPEEADNTVRRYQFVASERKYVPTTEVVQNASYMRSVANTLMNEVESLIRRNAAFFAMYGEFNEVEHSLQGVSEKLKAIIENEIASV